MSENEISSIIIREAIAIHRSIGPGLLEKVYLECLYFRLLECGLKVEKEKPMPIVFQGVHLDCGYRADLIVEGKVLIEVKAIEAIAPIHKTVVLTYLRFGNYKLGLLINFHTDLLKDGIKRVVNGL